MGLKMLHKKGYILFILIAVCSICVSALLRTMLASFMNVHFFLAGKQQPSFSEIFLSSLLNIFIWVQLLTVGKMIWDRIQNQRYIAAMEHEKAITELNFLKAQINPHFLFNSLNSIYGYIDKNNKTARNILLKFSEMLRYQLYECNTNSISIKKEIEYVRNYVALQQYRKEENLIVHLQIEDPPEGFEIAPLILVVFIENAFKYVSNFDSKENKIIISLSFQNRMLSFYIFNTTEHRQQGLCNGIGLANVKRRLEILYPDKHKLNINKGEEFYETKLKINLS